jgi:hypothetical protein
VFEFLLFIRHCWWGILLLEVLRCVLNLDTEIVSLGVGLITGHWRSRSTSRENIWLWQNRVRTVWLVDILASHWLDSLSCWVVDWRWRIRTVSSKIYGLPSRLSLDFIFPLILCATACGHMQFAFEVLYLVLQWFELALHYFSGLLIIVIFLDQVLTWHPKRSSILWHCRCLMVCRTDYTSAIRLCVIFEGTLHHLRGWFH